jgi:N utilization substance protein B
MRNRSRAREAALQLLYQHDFNPAAARETVTTFVHARLRDPALEPFCLSLYDGVLSNQEAIDAQLARATENWRLPRMAAVDRNVLRLGAYELAYTPETPPRVVLDEAIELARRYGSAESSAFVNGVLDKILAGPGTAPADPGTAEQPSDPSSAQS